jgi:hypothetical protein
LRQSVHTNFEACSRTENKKRENSTFARHYDQIRSHFHTAWANCCSGVCSKFAHRCHLRFHRPSFFRQLGVIPNSVSY